MQTLAGRVLFQFYYDIGGEISMEKLNLSELTVIRKAQPKSVRVLAPKFEEAGLKPVAIDFGVKKVENINFNVEAKVYPIGVVEVTLSLDFKNSSFEDIIRLVNMSEGFVRLGGKEVEFEKIPGEYFRTLQSRIQKALVYPYEPYDQPEVYRVVIISSIEPKLRAEEFLSRFRKQIAGVLRGEKSWEKLSEKEIEDVLRFQLSYSEDEAIVVDWYSSLIFGGEEYVDEILQTIEIAKIQLLELKTYDKLLDKRIEKAYGSLRSVFVHSGVGIAWLSKTYAELSRTASDLAELRIEVVDYVHDLRNILKFTGDWYLGKLYSALGERFRIMEWLNLVDKKLEQLQELYSMAMERVDVYRAMSLEFLVMLLIISLVVLEVFMVIRL